MRKSSPGWTGRSGRYTARLMTNEHMAAYNDAKTELDKLVNQIATIVTMSAQGEDPEGYLRRGLRRQLRGLQRLSLSTAGINARQEGRGSAWRN